MQFMHQKELWGQILVIAVITWVSIFQKISNSEFHFLSQTKNHCPKSQQDQFSLAFDINLQVSPWVPPMKVVFF